MLKILHYTVNNVCIVTINGKLNHESYALFDAYMANLSNYNYIVLDCRNLNSLSSVGLQSLIILAKSLDNLNGHIILCEVNLWVKDLLDISGINKFIPYCDHLQQAITCISND